MASSGDINREIQLIIDVINYKIFKGKYLVVMLSAHEITEIVKHYSNREQTLFQIQRLMSNREMFGRAEDQSVFAIPGGRVRKKQRALSTNIRLLMQKN